MAEQRSGQWVATVWLGLRISAQQWNTEWLGAESPFWCRHRWVTATLGLSIRGLIGNVHVFDAIIFAGFVECLAAVSWGGQRPEIATA